MVFRNRVERGLAGDPSELIGRVLGPAGQLVGHGLVLDGGGDRVGLPGPGQRGDIELKGVKPALV